MTQQIVDDWGEVSPTAIMPASRSIDAVMASTPTPGQLLQIALQNQSGIDVIERITAMMERERKYQAEVAFDDALNQCQAKIGRIAPNQKREHGITWADYAQLDRAIRLIYTMAGFSIAFSEVDSANKGKLRMKASLSRGGISKDYFAEIAQATANAGQNQMDADASAASRVKRYLLLDIFNIAIGIDSDEKVPYKTQQISEKDEAELQSWCDALQQAPDKPRLQNLFADAYKFAGKVGGEPAKKTVREVYEAMKRKMGAQ